MTWSNIFRQRAGSTSWPAATERSSFVPTPTDDHAVAAPVPSRALHEIAQSERITRSPVAVDIGHHPAQHLERGHALLVADALVDLFGSVAARAVVPKPTAVCADEGSSTQPAGASRSHTGVLGAFLHFLAGRPLDNNPFFSDHHRHRMSVDEPALVRIHQLLVILGRKEGIVIRPTLEPDLGETVVGRTRVPLRVPDARRCTSSRTAALPELT